MMYAMQNDVDEDDVDDVRDVKGRRCCVDGMKS